MFKFPMILRAPEGAEAGGGGGDGGAAAAAAAAGGEGGQPSSWYAPFKLDDASVRFIADRKFDGEGGLANLVKSSIESDRLARSRNVLEKPDPARVNEWGGWSELGWKPNFDEYALKKPKMPDGKNLQYEQGVEDTVRKIAHDQRVPLPAAQAILDGLVDYAVKAVDAVDARGAKANADLDTAIRKEWGGSYDRNVELARRAARHLGVGMDDSAQLEAIIGAPGLTKLFHKIGEALGEDTLVAAGGGALPESIDALRAELRRLQSDGDFMSALRDPRHMRHGDVVAQRQALIDKIAKLETGKR